jgi:hypothetical protein
MKLLGFFQVMFIYVDPWTVLFHTRGDEMDMDEGLSRMFYFFTTLHYAIFSFLSIRCPP